MLGAIIGDIVGSRWEFNPTNNYHFELFSDKNGFTDDTICTVAVADALLHDSDDFGSYIHQWCRKYPHPMGGYGGRFAQWVASGHPQPYGSYGNGSAMRVSPIGWWYSNNRPELAEKSAACTHNHPEGIKGARAVVLAMADALELRGKYGKKLTPEIVQQQGLVHAVELYDAEPGHFKLDLAQYRNRFDETCQGTVPVALWIVLHSTSFEDAIRQAVSLGADADTLGAIVGSIAESLWGIPEWMKKKALSYLPADMKAVVREFHERIKEQRKLAKDGKHETQGKLCFEKTAGDKEMDEKDKKLHLMALMRWKLGLGNFNMILQGKSPLPGKTRIATAKDGHLLPMPEEADEVSEIPFDMRIPSAAMDIIRKGHIPNAMEDHWFMYCDEEYIRYYRSWTGICAFEAHYRQDGSDFVIDRLKINRALVEFAIHCDEVAAALFVYLIVAESGGDAAGAWENYLQTWDKFTVIKN